MQPMFGGLRSIRKLYKKFLKIMLKLKITNNTFNIADYVEYDNSSYIYIYKDDKKLPNAALIH